MTPSNTNGPEQFFHPGDAVAESGIYRIYHAGHRSPHDATLLKDERFPRCVHCGDSVSFELVRKLSAVEDRDFRIRIYAIPPEAA